MEFALVGIMITHVSKLKTGFPRRSLGLGMNQLAKTLPSLGEKITNVQRASRSH